MNKSPIFLIVCIATDYEDRSPSLSIKNRTFGFAHSLEDANNLIEKYGHEIQECYYDYLVVEEHLPAIHSNVISENWYVWEEKKWVKIDKPKCFTEEGDIVNFGMG